MAANELKILTIKEFSLVPNEMGRPANEHAQVLLTKAQEGGEQMPPNDGISAEVQKAIEAAEARATAEIAKARSEAAAEIAKANERLAAADEREAFAKCEQRLASQGISKALAPDIRTLEKANPEATGRIVDALAKAEKRAAAVERLTKAAGEYVAPTEGSPAARLNKAVSDLQASDSSLTREQAITKAVTKDPSLYAAMEQK